MERLHGTHKAPKHESEEDEDYVSRMPENVITNILDRLPIQDAVGTCILSTNWRFKWNLLTQLVFDFNFFKYLLDNDGEDIGYTRYIISRILLDVKGPITKFVLNIPNLDIFDAKDIFNWVVLLSGKGIKDLTLTKWHGTPFKLSLLPFSFLDLKDLTLIGISFYYSSSFCGFPNLLSLDLDMVRLEAGNIGAIIGECPLLENLVVTNYDPVEEVKLVYLGRLEHLKRLSIPVRKLDNISSIRFYIFRLGRFFPKLRRLTLSFSECKFLGEGEPCADSARTIFPCLKTLELYEIDLTFSMLSCAMKMIWGSPNLKSLTIMIRYDGDDDNDEDEDEDDIDDDDDEDDDDDDDDVTPSSSSPPDALTPSEVDYNTLGKLQLQYVEFVCLGSENEVRLVKYLLACSPLLKKMVINTYMMFDGKMEFAKKLLKLHRASPTVDVEFTTSLSLLNLLSVSYNHGS